MRIEIFADFICPWCGIGVRRFDQALERFEHRDEVEIVRRAFQLNERAEIGVTEPSAEMLARRGYSPEALETMHSRIEGIAKESGVQPFHVKGNLVGSTALAHELAAFAEEEGRGEEAWEALFQAYFGEQRSIFTVPELRKIGEEIGLDGEALSAALHDRLFEEKVKEDIRRARTVGVTGVPFFIVGDRYAVSGAQTPEHLLEVMERAWSER